MSGTLEFLWNQAPVQSPATLLLGFLVYLLLGFLPSCGALYLIYFCLTLPMRRAERARLVLDLLEMGLKEGRSPEAALVEAAASRDTSPGARFHLLAAHLETGLRLSQALERVPRLLPPQIQAMLGAGERIGDVAKSLPACRLLLKDSISQVRGALNYVVILTFLATPFMIFVPLALKVLVLPKFREIFAGMMEGAQLPGFTRLVFSSDTLTTCLQVGLLSLVWLAAIGYLGGPRLRQGLNRVLPGGSDWLLARLPWRRRRLQRDFSAMLAVLLEAGVPEIDAVTLAGEATANAVFRRRAAQAAIALQQGAPLPQALRALDPAGELPWRLTNALRAGTGFVRALTGWHEALDAKAFQQEQTAAQLTTTAFVLFNGLVVASIVIGMFLALIQLLNRATLW